MIFEMKNITYEDMKQLFNEITDDEKNRIDKVQIIKKTNRQFLK